MYGVCIYYYSICFVSTINNKALIELGKQLRARREACNYAQRDVSQMTGITINTISALENGNGATLNNFLLICRAVHTHPKDIFQLDMDLTPLYTLPPFERKRIEIALKLKNLIFETDFFEEPKRVSEVIERLESNKKESNKFSVYLSGYCKEGALDYIRVGNIKKYTRKNKPDQ